MGRIELAFRWAAPVALLASLSCAANTSDDPAAAGAANGGAPSTPSGGAPPVGSAGASAGGAPSTGGAPPAGAGAPAAAGAAGAPTTGSCPALDAADMVSDFESGKAEVLKTGGRGGSWFLFNDGTGMQTPMKVVNTPLAAEAGGACASLFGFHSTGSGFTVFGAGMGLDFAPKVAMATASTVYDGSAYTGIAMYVKAAAAIQLRVSVSDAGTAPEGMICSDTTDKADPKRCGDYFGTEIPIGTDWKDYVMPFESMTQRGFGLPITTGIDKSKLYSLRAQIKGSAALPGSYDLWVDNVRFVK